MADPQDWRTRAIGALGAVLAVALVVGGVVGAIAYGAARVTGLTGGDQSAQATQAADPASGAKARTTATPHPTPSRRTAHQGSRRASTTKQSEHATPSHSHSSKRREHPRKHDKHKKQAHKKARSGPLTLNASPHHVGPMGRIDLTGRYPRHDGATLVVQRFKGGHWARFPVTARVRGGDFRTWVQTGHHGPNRFRVVDQGTGAASDPVTVRVG